MHQKVCLNGTIQLHWIYYILTTEQGQGGAGNETTSAVQTRRGDGEPFPT